MNTALSSARLYGIIDLGYVLPADIAERTEQLLSGGVDILQLRAKNKPIEHIKTWANEIKPLCQRAGIPFIVNDYPQIAKEVGADGVHIGQEDGTLAAVREVVGYDMIVGRSTHSAAQALAAEKEGFDYIGFGPLYATPTKQGRAAIGLENVRDVQQSVGGCIPVFCIGGIKPENLDQVTKAGGKRVVIVSGLLCADDPEKETRAVKGRLL